MTHANADLTHIQAIRNAGRGVVAAQTIPKDTLILKTTRPAVHVIHREYRKEVCAQCFHYALGRTLPVKHVEMGKLFCSETCRDGWVREQRDVGVAAWRALYDFVRERGSAVSSLHSLATVCEKPQVEIVEREWKKTEDVVERLQASSSTAKAKKTSNSTVPMDVVDPDILSFLLSGILFHHQHPERWQSDILNLAMDLTPYKGLPDLRAHVNSFIQLASILPSSLRGSLTSPMCQTLISAASHNAFGIRSGSEDGEEYLGWALYPEASYFNHSCKPNVGKKRIGAIWEFRALREIGQDEECCITYLGGDEEELTLVSRRSRLRGNWGFECECGRCVEESEIG